MFLNARNGSISHFDSFSFSLMFVFGLLSFRKLVQPKWMTSLCRFCPLFPFVLICSVFSCQQIVRFCLLYSLLFLLPFVFSYHQY